MGILLACWKRVANSRQHGAGVLLCAPTRTHLPLPCFLRGKQKLWPLNLNPVFDVQLFIVSFIWNSHDSEAIFLMQPCNCWALTAALVDWKETELHFTLFGWNMGQRRPDLSVSDLYKGSQMNFPLQLEVSHSKQLGCSISFSDVFLLSNEANLVQLQRPTCDLCEISIKMLVLYLPEVSLALFLFTIFFKILLFWTFLCVEVLFSISYRSTLHKNNLKVKCAFDLWRVSRCQQRPPLIYRSGIERKH